MSIDGQSTPKPLTNKQMQHLLDMWQHQHAGDDWTFKESNGTTLQILCEGEVKRRVTLLPCAEAPNNEPDQVLIMARTQNMPAWQNLALWLDIRYVGTVFKQLMEWVEDTSDIEELRLICLQGLHASNGHLLSK